MQIARQIYNPKKKRIAIIVPIKYSIPIKYIKTKSNSSQSEIKIFTFTIVDDNQSPIFCFNSFALDK